MIDAADKAKEAKEAAAKAREDYEAKMKEAEAGGVALSPELQAEYEAALAQAEAAEEAFAKEQQAMAESQEQIRALQEKLAEEEEERERQVEEFRAKLEEGEMGMVFVDGWTDPVVLCFLVSCTQLLHGTLLSCLVDTRRRRARSSSARVRREA